MPEARARRKGGVGGIPPRPSVPPSEARRLCQISLFGFVYQIWQDNFKSMPRRELVLLRGLRWF